MIYILRHGQTEWNVSRKLQGHKSIPLTEEGRNMAADLVEKIKTLEFKRIISSDLLRARQTAEIINKEIQKEIFFDSRLRSVDYGLLEGRLIANITQEEWDIYNHTPEIFGAESMEAVYNRVKSIFDELIDNEESVLIVTHGGVLRVLAYYITHREVFDNEIYCRYYKDAKQRKNMALFGWDVTLSELKAI